MKRNYAKIINKGECLSTINTTAEFVNKWKSETIRLKAGKNEWEKHGFYPKNNMIGEIIDSFENTLWGFKVFILLINETFYVPISENGIQFIGEDEFLKSKSSGFTSISPNLDSITTPDFRNLFVNDLKSNFLKLSFNKTKRITIEIALEEIAMYSSDMIIEFKKKSQGVNFPNINEIIVSQVHDSVSTIYPNFPKTYFEQSIKYVNQLLMMDNIEEKVKEYYKSITLSYNLWKACSGT